MSKKKFVVDTKKDITNLEGLSGICVYCESDDLDYGAVELESESMYYPVHCNHCLNDYREYYDLTFSGNYGYPLKKKGKK